MEYEDLNDHEDLHLDPIFVLALGKTIGKEKEPTIFAGKITLNR